MIPAPTPISDANAGFYNIGGEFVLASHADPKFRDAYSQAVKLEFARQLERERNEALRRAEAAESDARSIRELCQAQGVKDGNRITELEDLISAFLGRCRMGEVGKGMFVQREELEEFAAALAPTNEP